MTARDQISSPDEVEHFEGAMERLSQIVRDLEGGNLSLDESLSSYEAGIRYLKQCQKILSTAERKVELLSGFDADGNPVTQRFDDEDLSLEEKADQRSRRRTASSKTKKADKSPKTKPELKSSAVDVDENGTLF